MSAAPIRVHGLSFADNRAPPDGPYCCICFKPLKPGKRYRLVYMTTNACAVHADDVPRLPPAGEDFRAVGRDGREGSERLFDGAPDPIGTDCARRIGLEWSVASPTPAPDARVTP